MKKLKYILSAIVSIILLVSLMTFCNTTVMAATKIPSTSISSIKVKNEAITVKWKKKSGITGYQIQYSTDSKFKKEKKFLDNFLPKKQKTQEEFKEKILRDYSNEPNKKFVNVSYKLLDLMGIK